MSHDRTSFVVTIKVIFIKVFLQVTSDIDKTIFFPTLYANCVVYAKINL